MLPLYRADQSRGSKFITIKEKLRGWWRILFADEQSRNLFMFLLLNLSFAFVELFYGMWTNSLSLISDSFHMFFDCTGLLAGIIASLITKWRPNEKYSYGYVRAETLSGFINGLFLVFVAFFIFSEAVERSFEPPEVHHERLFVVSVLGFIVNLIGIFVFQHGGASHSGCSHGHSHGGTSSSSQNGNVLTNHSYYNDSSPFTNSNPSSSHHGHSHDNSSDHHGHSHDSMHAKESLAPAGSQQQILKGVFLHILADTLGSVGVIISSILMWAFGWMIADPICSMCISVLIVLSVIPLVKDSLCVLMMRSPRELDFQLPECYRKLQMIEGVYSVHEPHFFTLCSDVFVGMVKLEVAPSANPKYINSTAHAIFQQAGVKQVYIQLDFAPV